MPLSFVASAATFEFMEGRTPCTPPFHASDFPPAITVTVAMLVRNGQVLPADPEQLFGHAVTVLSELHPTCADDVPELHTQPSKWTSDMHTGLALYKTFQPGALPPAIEWAIGLRSAAVMAQRASPAFGDAALPGLMVQLYRSGITTRIVNARALSPAEQKVLSPTTLRQPLCVQKLSALRALFRRAFATPMVYEPTFETPPTPITATMREHLDAYNETSNGQKYSYKRLPPALQWALAIVVTTTQVTLTFTK